MAHKAEHKNYLILKGSAGLGNRIFCVCDAINYARQNQRALYVDWDDGQMAPYGTNAFYRFFELKGVNAVTDKSELPSGNYMPKAFASEGCGIYDDYYLSECTVFSRLPLRVMPKGRARMLIRYWKRIDNGDKSYSFAKHVAGIFDKRNFPYGSDLKDHYKERLLVYADFSPLYLETIFKEHVALRQEIQSEIMAFAKEKELNKAAAVHIRFTDKQPTKAIDSLVSTLKSKNEQLIFLATDNKEIEALFRKNFNTLVTYPKYLPDSSRDGLHQFALYNNRDDLKLQITKESIMDLGLLASCKTFYYQGNSSFSIIARSLHARAEDCINWLN